MLEVSEEVLKVITIFLVVGTVIFAIWTAVLFFTKNKKWENMAVVTAFSLMGAVITPFVDILANKFSFEVRLGLSTIIIVSYALYTYRKSKKIQ